MLYQHDYVLSPANKIQLLWGDALMFTAAREKIFQEIYKHLNCIIKGCTHGQRSNQDDKAVVRVSQALGSLVPVLNNFDQVHEVPDLTGAPRKNEERDQKLIIAELQKSKIFQTIPSRQHKNFPTPRNVRPKELMHERMVDKLSIIIIMHGNQKLVNGN